jgi:hypothetical protein
LVSPDVCSSDVFVSLRFVAAIAQPDRQKLLQQWINKQSKTGTFRLLQGLTGKSILKYLLG